MEHLDKYLVVIEKFFFQKINQDVYNDNCGELQKIQIHLDNLVGNPKYQTSILLWKLWNRIDDFENSKYPQNIAVRFASIADQPRQQPTKLLARLQRAHDELETHKCCLDHEVGTTLNINGGIFLL